MIGKVTVRGVPAGTSLFLGPTGSPQRIPLVQPASGETGVWEVNFTEERSNGNSAIAPLDQSQTWDLLSVSQDGSSQTLPIPNPGNGDVNIQWGGSALGQAQQAMIGRRMNTGTYTGQTDTGGTRASQYAMNTTLTYDELVAQNRELRLQMERHKKHMLIGVGVAAAAVTIYLVAQSASKSEKKGRA